MMCFYLSLVEIKVQYFDYPVSSFQSRNKKHSNEAFKGNESFFVTSQFQAALFDADDSLKRFSCKMNSWPVMELNSDQMRTKTSHANVYSYAMERSFSTIVFQKKKQTPFDSRGHCSDEIYRICVSSPRIIPALENIASSRYSISAHEQQVLRSQPPIISRRPTSSDVA